MMRFLSRLLMMLALIGAIVVIALSIGWPPNWTLDALNPMAASLAVITAVIGAWGTQTILERDEDARQPNPYLLFDATSRYGLMQLVLRNAGGTPAFDVRIQWNKLLANSKGIQVRFTDSPDGIEAPILLPGESISVFVNGTVAFFKQADLVFTGTIRYACRPKGKLRKQPFYLSGEQYRHALMFAEELPRTLHDLQKVPGRLDRISRDLQSLNWTLTSYLEHADEGLPTTEETNRDDNR